VDISGYGEAGPKKDYKAYDLLVRCLLTKVMANYFAALGFIILEIVDGAYWYHRCKQSRQFAPSLVHPTEAKAALGLFCDALQAD